MSIFEGKTALVTGAASGIGRATALALSRQGARLVIADIDQAGGQETLRLIEAQGGAGMFFPLDVSQPASIRAFFAGLFGVVDRLHLAVNNAGTAGTSAPFQDYPEEAWNRVIAINQSGVFYCMQEELRHMASRGGGAIVNVASIAGLQALPLGAAYVASKHAVLGLTKTAAVEYARFRVRVNAVCPAFTLTPMVEALFQADPSTEQKLLKTIPMRRYGDVSDIAGAICWLCDDQASGFVTGIGLPLDGGMTA